jgi:hypothetical protein
MKKITILAVAALAISLASCKKSYTCACTTTINFNGSTISNAYYKDDATSYSKKMNKKTAQAACDNKKASLDASWKNGLTDNGTYPNPGITASTSCDLKD